MQHANRILGIVAAIVIALALYAVAYLTMLVGPRMVAVQYNEGNTTSISFDTNPQYRSDSAVIGTIFRPANCVDAWLRPQKWNGNAPAEPGALPAGPPHLADPVPSITPAARILVAVRLTGPTQMTVGKEQQYQIEVRNESEQPLNGLVVSLQYSDSLTLTAATSDAEFSLNSVQWTLEQLPVGQAVVFEIKAKAARPDAKSRTLATVKLAHSRPESSEVTTVISAAPVENRDYFDFDKTIPRGFSDSQEYEEASEEDESALSKARRSTKYKRLSKPLQPGQYDD